MEDIVGHNCGLVVTHTLRDVYEMLRSLQHRGREAAGIAAITQQGITVVKWIGRVRDFDAGDLFGILEEGHTFFGHVRYATSGRKDQILKDAHPHVIGGKVYDHGSHIIIEDPDIVGVHNGQIDPSYFSDLEQKTFQTGCDTERLLYYYREKGEREILKSIPGAYTLAIADKKRKDIIVLRDKTGIKPGILWKKEEKFGVASEDVALRNRNAEFVEDLIPGMVYHINEFGPPQKVRVVPALSNKRCYFEWNYIAHYETNLDGTHVTRLRQALGEQFATEFNPDGFDYVTFLPRCPAAAAQRYAQTIGVPFIKTFYKMRNERAFQGSTTYDRAASIENNLYLNHKSLDRLHGKRVLMMDDSIIRGNNVRKARQLLYNEAGVAEAVLLSYTPQIGIIGEDGEPRGCMFGVDMPPTDNFIARNRTVDEISTEIGMRIVYLSVQGMLTAFERAGIPRSTLCTYCIGGSHPFK